jgi:hypothetical protein
MMAMGTRFRPPPRDDDRRWASISFLADHGFRYQQVFHTVDGERRPVPYPDSMGAARRFVLAFELQAYPVAR